jgi:hypothetical protein
VCMNHEQLPAGPGERRIHVSVCDRWELVLESPAADDEAYGVLASCLVSSAMLAGPGPVAAVRGLAFYTVGCRYGHRPATCSSQVVMQFIHVLRSPRR